MLIVQCNRTFLCTCTYVNVRKYNYFYIFYTVPNCLKIRMDLPSGPLDIYRKKASFNSKEMLQFIEGGEIQAYKVQQKPFHTGAIQTCGGICGISEHAFFIHQSIYIKPSAILKLKAVVYCFCIILYYSSWGVNRTPQYTTNINKSTLICASRGCYCHTINPYLDALTTIGSDIIPHVGPESLQIPLAFWNFFGKFMRIQHNSQVLLILL